MRGIRFFVLGTPGPQGSKRHVGRGIMIESSKLVKPWREAVVWAALEEIQRRDGHGIIGPVEVTLCFTLVKPKSAPKNRKTWPDKRPDIDKLTRSTLDALVTAGAIEDDARVVKMMAEKVFPCEGPNSLGVPGCVVSIHPVIAV